ncbi:MAG TPA: hypothetical protein VIC08_14150 [Cellvibrionaceae bacterium]
MKAISALFMAFSLLLTSGCYHLQAAKAPMPALSYYHADAYQPGVDSGQRAKDLLVYLPGMGDYMERFEGKDLQQPLFEAGLPIDIKVADAHFAYYRARTFNERLHQDIIAPAREEGYQRIYLVGISLGGFGALLHWRETGDIDAVLLLTPYLGEPEYYAHLVDKNQQATALDEDKNIWPWLEELPPEAMQHWYVGRARDDKFFTPNSLLSDRLPPANTVTVDGGHDWNAWLAMWPQLLAKLERDFYSE